MKSTLPTLLLCTVLAGCKTPFRAPADVAHIKLATGDSPVVVVEKIWLERKTGPLTVTGYVLMQLEADDTSRTHLDVILYDATGRVLRTTVAQFEPRQIVRRYRREPHARYTVSLDPLPAGTERIEVRAHEGGHGAG
jgi:hypothetical protein